MNWTEEQQQVIGLRNSNILVSAAAGSGKTAVLIERIMSRIMDPEQPVSIDEFLIVTFTRAAAAQMKERLQRALEDALKENPENEHLQQQVMLVPMAQISTIHSFCGTVIQNYFHRTGVDPSYRVASDNELLLIKADVMQEMLEEKYSEASEEFMQIAVMSRFVKSDEEMEQIILSLYSKAVSDPFPSKFLERMKAFVQMETVEELKNSEFIKKNSEYVIRLIRGICEEYESMLSLCEAPGGPFWYKEVLEDDRNQLESLCQMTDYEELGKGLMGICWMRLPSKRPKDSDKALKERVLAMRNAIKDTVKSLVKDLFDRSLEEQLLQLRQMRGTVTAFINLTQEFMDRYRAKKSEKALVDYNDLEQMAMEILFEEDEDGVPHRTEAAVELSEQFAEIMIDEYQDSNLVQEMLLSSVASENNRFMVGDIKQSIYRFRMACPDLFLDKLSRYGTEEGERDRLVNLTRNFRSRDVVLDGTNAIFEKIMHRELGDVEYDKDARLYPGAEFPDAEKQRVSDSIDVYALRGKDDGSYEGKIIAGLIQEYMGEDNPLYVYEDGGYRKVRYGDIVILARSTKAIGQQIYEVLASEGIPVYMENTKGFFDTREISLMVNLLHIIDNPRQDIPLAAVMRSPVFEFTDDELAILRGKNRDRDFYDSLLLYVSDTEETAEGDEVQLIQKTESFLSLLNHFREMMTYKTVADIIQEIYDCTHIDYILMAMKNGAQRKANLDLLMNVAREFDSSSYKGLYQFVRYISGIRKRDEDLGEANLLGDKDDVVRIMTVHKSKGLEFPVCILAGMGRDITKSSDSSFLVTVPSAGIASRNIDNDRGISSNNVFYRSLIRMNQMEDLGEELRVLYVAMTRAKEKLVMTGCAQEDKIPLGTGYFQRINGKSYYDWILPVVLSCIQSQQEDNPLFTFQWVEPEELEQREIRRQADEIIDEVMLNNFDTTLTYDKEIKTMLEFVEEYQAEEREELPTKLSVSEIKKRSMEEHEEDGFTVLDVEALENQSPVPKFAAEGPDGSESAADNGNGALAGAGYGTVWHQVMAGIDFSHTSSEREVEEELRSLAECGRIREPDLKYISVYRLMAFFKSPLGQEMKKAKLAGTLYREQPFVIGVKAAEVLPDTESTEEILVQGIIDGFYETEEGIVLMDYKTDHLEKGQEGILTDRYRKQMELYARALTGITGKRVIKMVLYSFSLGKEVEL